MPHRRWAAVVLAVLVLAARPAPAVVPFTHIETGINPSTTSLYVPPQSPEAVQVVWPFTITPKPAGVTEGSVESAAGGLLEFFGPGLQQYHLATAYIRGVAKADFGVLRAWAYAAGGVAPKSWGPPFVTATNPYGAAATVVMRPQFTDSFVVPATPGAPNVGDTQVLRASMHLDGTFGGDARVTWLIRMIINSEAPPYENVYFSTSSTSGCGGPCPFPVNMPTVEFETKVGTSYVVFGDVGVTAFAGGNADSVDDGWNGSSIDVASTGSFVIRVKETGAGVVGVSGRDYGAAVPASDLVIPTTTTIKIPPDSTTSTTTTTTVTTSTTLPGGTTTTTSLPTIAEICDNCVDDDGDGLVDVEDGDCCSGAPLAASLRKAKLTPGTAGTATQLTATLAGAASAGLDPTLAGLTLQARDPSAGLLLCARLSAAGFAKKKKGKLLQYKDAAGTARGITAASLRVGKSDVTLVVGGKQVRLDGALGQALGLTIAVADASGRRCGTIPPAPLRATGKKGALKYP